jgi:hypothetical protein
MERLKGWLWRQFKRTEKPIVAAALAKFAEKLFIMADEVAHEDWVVWFTVHVCMTEKQFEREQQ